MNEQRKYKRYKSSCVIEATGAHGRRLHPEASSVVNISEGGLSFYSAEEVEPKSHIKVRIDIPDFNSSLEANAQVKWTQSATERPGTYFVGVQFEAMPEDKKGLLRKLQDKTDS